MKERFQQLFQAFMAANAATRVALIVGTVVLFTIGGATSWFANRQEFVEIWSNLTPEEASEYKKALANAGIDFRSSPPPDYGIWVDIADRDAAEAQVALAGYSPKTKGIQVSDGGAASAFLSARAREQMSDKREWQECEVQLERLQFVLRATVTTSGTEASPFTPDKSATVSVTLGLRPGEVMDDAKSRTVASLVRGRFNVPMENIIVVDEQGRLLHDGMESGGGMSGSDLFAHQQRFDSALEREANKLLERSLGPGVGYVTVTSTWEYNESETISEEAQLGSGPYYESTSESKSKGGGSSVGGPAGTSANITQDFGVENAGTGATSSGGGSFDTTRSEKRSPVGKKTTHETKRTPELTRMSVSLVMDESQAQQVDTISNMIKATVGFDEQRNDLFSASTLTLHSLERDEEGNIITPEAPEPAEPPNAYIELILKYGVEILAALGFLVVLLKSLKGGSAVASGASAGGGTGRSGSTGTGANGSPIVPGTITEANPQGITEEEIANIDPSLLARTQVEDLVRNHPEKVSEILAYWASNSRTVGAGR